MQNLEFAFRIPENSISYVNNEKSEDNFFFYVLSTVHNVIIKEFSVMVLEENATVYGLKESLAASAYIHIQMTITIVSLISPLFPKNIITLLAKVTKQQKNTKIVFRLKITQLKLKILIRDMNMAKIGFRKRGKSKMRARVTVTIQFQTILLI